LDLQKDYAFEILTKHFQTVSFKGFGIADLKAGIISRQVALAIIRNIGTNISRFTNAAEDAYVRMDRFTIRNPNCTTRIQMQSRCWM
jgi:DNA mismatch repair protein MutS